MNRSNHVVNNKHELNNFIDMDTLLINLKNEDARNLRNMKNLKWMFFHYGNYLHITHDCKSRLGTPTSS